MNDKFEYEDEDRCGTLICPNCGDGAEANEDGDGHLVCVECGSPDVRVCGCKII